MLLHCATLLSRLPLKVHYGLADCLLFPLMYHVVRYRRKTVDKNLRLAFPDKTDKERASIARGFYHQFCDILVETIYSFGCADEELRQRVVFEGLEEADRLMQQAGGGVFLLGHTGNWEWLVNLPMWLSPEMKHLIVYKRLRNKAADRLMLAVRSKRGGVCVDKKQIFRETERYHAAQTPFTVFLVGDQKPRPDARQQWLSFLHQETGFFTGAEALSRKYGLPVAYLHINRPQRGCYKVQVHMLTVTPESSAEGEITRAYAQALEQNILEQPELWLWSHNRFKWKRP